MTFDRQLQDRLGSVLFRLTTIERRAAAAGESPRAAARLLDDVRKVTGELERAFADVRETLEHSARLETRLAVAASRTQMLFDLVPVACLLIDDGGMITDANPEAVKLLNVSRRHLVGRSFQLYLGGDRDTFQQRLRGLTNGDEQQSWDVPVRPRERGALLASLTLASDPEGGVLVILQPMEAAVRTPLRAVLKERPRGTQIA
jgi:PAS domain-containing protein